MDTINAASVFVIFHARISVVLYRAWICLKYKTTSKFSVPECVAYHDSGRVCDLPNSRFLERFFHDGRTEEGAIELLASNQL